MIEPKEANFRFREDSLTWKGVRMTSISVSHAFEAEIFHNALLWDWAVSCGSFIDILCHPVPHFLSLSLSLSTLSSLPSPPITSISLSSPTLQCSDIGTGRLATLLHLTRGQKQSYNRKKQRIWRKCEKAKQPLPLAAIRQHCLNRTKSSSLTAASTCHHKLSNLVAMMIIRSYKHTKHTI